MGASKVVVHAGICRNLTTIRAISDDDQMVRFEIESMCKNIQELADKLTEPIDAYEEIGTGSDGIILTASRETLKGCCSACAVPIALFKAMQVAAGLALPKDVIIEIEKASAKI
jgi:hypothetical protein